MVKRLRENKEVDPEGSVQPESHPQDEQAILEEFFQE